MTAPNPAVGALPGWRGTDPDGGTWLRRFPDAESAWFEFTADGHLVLRSQEEAEAAGLMPLDALSWWEREVLDAARKAFTGDTDPGEQIIETDDYTVQVSRWAGDDTPAAPAPLDPGSRAVAEWLIAEAKAEAETARALWNAMVASHETDSELNEWIETPDWDLAQEHARIELLAPGVEPRHLSRDGYVAGLRVGRRQGVDRGLTARPAAPAPLDPDNPDVRAVADALRVLEQRWPGHGVLRNARTFLTVEIVRLDRERDEAEQDAADRKRAGDYVREVVDAAEKAGEQTQKAYWFEVENAYVEGIRAERARKEAGQ